MKILLFLILSFLSLSCQPAVSLPLTPASPPPPSASLPVVAPVAKTKASTPVTEPVKEAVLILNPLTVKIFIMDYPKIDSFDSRWGLIYRDGLVMTSTYSTLFYQGPEGTNLLKVLFPDGSERDAKLSAFLPDLELILIEVDTSGFKPLNFVKKPVSQGDVLTAVWEGHDPENIKVVSSLVSHTFRSGRVIDQVMKVGVTNLGGMALMDRSQDVVGVLIYGNKSSESSIFVPTEVLEQEILRQVK